MSGNSFGMFFFSNGLAELKYLSLENSNVTEFSAPSLKSLISLNLAKNNIRLFPNLSSQNKLNYLDISGNKLEGDSIYFVILNSFRFFSIKTMCFFEIFRFGKLQYFI